MSPCEPRPPESFGGPSPRRRWTVPLLVPGGTRSFLRPLSVGTSTSAPRMASGIVSGTSTSRLSTRRWKAGDAPTGVTTYRSPGGPPLRPASPLPARRTREPSLTPAGMFTRYFLIVRCAPLPLQVGHGSSITVPAPLHSEHGCEIENRPSPRDSIPRPWHFGQTCGEVPGLAPVPWQVGQVALVGTDSGICAPSIACSNEIETSASRSRPRSWRGWRGPPAVPPPAPPP